MTVLLHCLDTYTHTHSHTQSRGRGGLQMACNDIWLCFCHGCEQKHNVSIQSTNKVDSLPA